MTMSLLPMRSSADAVHVDAPQSDLRATPSSVGQELKTLISNELQPFSDTGITREMLRNSFQAKRPPKAVLKNDFVWVRILNQSRIFVKHSETSKDPLVPHYRHNGFLQGLRRIVKSLPDVEFVAAMNDEPPCDMEVSMHAPIMTWSKRHSPPCNNIRLPCWSIMQDEYAVGKRFYDFETQYKLGAGPFAEKQNGMAIDFTLNTVERKDALKQLRRLESAKTLKYPIVRAKAAHAIAYRYQLHAEGRTYSMRLKNLLASGTLAVFLFKTNMTDMTEPGHNPVSMYHEYWYDLMKPGKQYFHLDSVGDTDPLRNLTDAEAAAIAHGGRNFAWSYLRPKQADKYVSHLLREYASLLRFIPSREPMQFFHEVK